MGLGCKNRKISRPRNAQELALIAPASGPASQAMSSATGSAGTVIARAL
jgi:hypothetical protein